MSSGCRTYPHQSNTMNFSPHMNGYGNVSDNGSYQNQYPQQYGNSPSSVEMFYRKNGGKFAGHNQNNHRGSPYHNKGPRNSYKNNFQSPNRPPQNSGSFYTSTPTHNSRYNSFNSSYSSNNSTPRHSFGSNNGSYNKRRNNNYSQKNNKFNQSNGQEIASYFSNSMIQDPWTNESVIKTCKDEVNQEKLQSAGQTETTNAI